jgi:hypothetical protein
MRSCALRSETIRERANLVAALVVGQVATRQAESWLILAGVAAWLGLVGWGLLLEGNQQWWAPC